MPCCFTWRCWKFKEKRAYSLSIARWALNRLTTIAGSSLVVWRKHDILLQLRTDLFVDILVEILLKLNNMLSRALPLPIGNNFTRSCWGCLPTLLCCLRLIKFKERAQLDAAFFAPFSYLSI